MLFINNYIWFTVKLHKLRNIVYLIFDMIAWFASLGSSSILFLSVAIGMIKEVLATGIPLPFFFWKTNCSYFFSNFVKRGISDCFVVVYQCWRRDCQAVNLYYLLV